MAVDNTFLIPETIETDRLLLQKLRYEDADEIFYTYASKPEATTFVSWPTHQSITDTRDFLRHSVEAWKLETEFTFSIRSRAARRMIGSFGVMNDHGKIQIGYILGPLHWHKGFATEACHCVINMLQTKPGIFRIGTFADAENYASHRVLLKSGFIEEARLREWFRFVNQGNKAKDCILFKYPLNYGSTTR